MIKKITTDQLQVGMYIHHLVLGWLNNPFTSSKFLLKSKSDILKIRDAGIKWVEIDTIKGLDTSGHKTVQSESEISVKPQIKSAKEEMEAAKVAFEDARQFISGVMNSAKMGQCVELEQVEPVIKDLSDSVLRNENALLGLTHIRNMDYYTFEHSVSFSVLMMSFAKGMGKSDEFICAVGIGGLLHDIGKTITPDHILNKPGKLTPEEFVIMKEHVVHSRIILEKTEGLSQISMDVAAMHHEKYDGNGYPLGLDKDQISLAGQMAAIVDVYDALTADRCYHKGKKPSEALQFLLKGAGSHFNPQLVQQFIQSVGIYPAGSVVLLSNDYLATVIEIKDNMLKPIVEIFFHTKTKQYVQTELIDLSTSTEIKVKNVDSYENWNIKPLIA